MCACECSCCVVFIVEVYVRTLTAQTLRGSGKCPVWESMCVPASSFRTLHFPHVIFFLNSALSLYLLCSLLRFALLSMRLSDSNIIKSFSYILSSVSASAPQDDSSVTKSVRNKLIYQYPISCCVSQWHF